MMHWEKRLSEAAYTPPGEGSVVDLYDAQRIALTAYAEGMKDYQELMEEFLNSDEINPKTIADKLKIRLDELMDRYGVTKDAGRDISPDADL